MQFRRPDHLESQHWSAFEVHLRRVTDAQAAQDVGAIIGGCKDLCECLSKIVITEAPTGFGKNDDFPKLLKRACSTLAAANPPTDGAEHVSQLTKGLLGVVTSLETAAQGLAQLRNDHGSGHGQIRLPIAATEDVALVESFTESWITWALARLERLLTNSVSVLIAELGGQNFYGGTLRRRLTEVGFEYLRAEEQERLGYAVASRGSRNSTFVVRREGVEPLQHDANWPLHYQFGVAKGLLLTGDGLLWPVETDLLSVIVRRLDPSLVERLLEDVESAPVDHRLSGELDSAQRSCAGMSMMTGTLRPDLRERWQALANRLAPALQ